VSHATTVLFTDEPKPVISSITLLIYITKTLTFQVSEKSMFKYQKTSFPAHARTHMLPHSPAPSVSSGNRYLCLHNKDECEDEEEEKIKRKCNRVRL
jgi:hypothetical protein